MGGEQDALGGWHGLDGVCNPRVEGVEVRQVGVGGRLDGGGHIGGGGGEACAEVAHLDARPLGRSPHVRVEAKLGFFVGALGRERPGSHLDALVATVDRVGEVAIAAVRVVDIGGAEDAGGDDHTPVEAGGGDGIVKEVFEVDSGDCHDVGLGEGTGLLRRHLVFVRGGVGGEQAGQAHRQGRIARVGTRVARLPRCVGLVQGDVAGGCGDLGDVVADLGGRGHDLEAVGRGSRGARSEGEEREAKDGGGHAAAGEGDHRDS